MVEELYVVTEVNVAGLAGASFLSLFEAGVIATDFSNTVKAISQVKAYLTHAIAALKFKSSSVPSEVWFKTQMAKLTDADAKMT